MKPLCRAFKRNFMPIRDFVDCHDANRQLQQWILEQAGHRKHGTTGEKPLSLFEIEQGMLKALPSVPPELAVWAKIKVHRDTHVQFEQCLYSVPYRLISQSLWLKAAPHTVRIYQGEELVAVHARLFIPNTRRTADDHLPPNALAYKMRDPICCQEQSRRVGKACHLLVCQLFCFANRPMAVFYIICPLYRASWP